MNRNIYLQGVLGEKFGTKFVVNGNTYKDIFSCINANRPEFKKYLIECHENDIGFTITEGTKQIDKEDLLEKITEQDITISIVPAGSKKGVGKIIAAAFVAYATFVTVGTAGSVFGVQAGSGLFGNAALAVAGGNTLYSSIGMGFATLLASTGLAELMAPDPSVDDSDSNNYLFTGRPVQPVEGDPVPVLYGELRVPGRAISTNVINGNFSNPSTIIDHNGNHYTFDNAKFSEISPN